MLQALRSWFIGRARLAYLENRCAALENRIDTLELLMTRFDAFEAVVKDDQKTPPAPPWPEGQVVVLHRRGTDDNG